MLIISNVFNFETNIYSDFIIVNQLGQTVKSFKVYRTAQNTINVDNMAHGIYFIKGTNGTQISSQRVIIKK
ncbi:T9SS type A sorting domain-containing protein [uncultured Flavobacterium sp.]|uniref:T9SS type A sorting domain-containing protein n=1 Tax=uncultured Flavobacterium sp. TaxID=165435 RepID=UPI0030ECA11C